MSDIVGTIRKFSLAGVSFDVMADANVSMVGGKYTNESVPTSGRNLRKMVRRSESFNAVSVACTGAEREMLKGYAESTSDIPITITLAGGDMFTCMGWIEFETTETETGKGQLNLHPRLVWDDFII